jgi:hypothetical protein
VRRPGTTENGWQLTAEDRLDEPVFAVDLTELQRRRDAEFGLALHRLALTARYGSLLAPVVALAARPLDLDAADSPGVERIVEPELEAVAALVADGSRRRRGRQGARLVVRPGERRVLTASGSPVVGGWAALQAWERRGRR